MDAVTAGCLALREQAAIYEEQLAGMEARHETVREDIKLQRDETARVIIAVKMTQNVTLRVGRELWRRAQILW